MSAISIVLILCLATVPLCRAVYYDGFTTSEGSDLCTLGPNTWCRSAQQQEICGVATTRAGICGYGSGKCPTQTIPDFCSNATTLAPNKTQFSYNGGLAGTPAGLFGYYALSLYWPPSNCDPNVVTNDSFCSQYTLAGNEASNHLVAHGLWPDFGSQYYAAPMAPAYKGAYQGWSQYCNGPDFDGYQCHANGGLCPFPNATSPTFSQSNYDDCMVYANITECQVDGNVFDALGTQFARYAPGYFSAPGSFINHEFTKHGSCVGGYLSRNQTAFFEQVVNITANVTQPGSTAYTLIHSNRGHSVDRATLEAAYFPTAVPSCQRSCNLDSVTYCIGRDAAGLPTVLEACSAGTLATANCASYNCTRINIPAYPGQAAAPSGQPAAAPSVTGAPAKAPMAASGPVLALPGGNPPLGAPVPTPVTQSG